MKLTKVFPSAAAVALAATLSMPAQAGFVVLDGWQLRSPGTAGLVTDIGRLNLVSGSAVVEQEVNAANNVFVGARFVESGNIFSISYTADNVVGVNDVGPPQILGEQLEISFNNVAGVVTGLVGSGFSYSFTSGDFLISGSAGNYATGSIIGIGGNANSTNVIGGVNGDSTLLGAVLSLLGGFGFNDSLGNSLDAAVLAGDVLFQAVTNNLAGGAVGSGDCSFDAAANCASFNVSSAGDAFLVRDIPEPSSLALAGLALFGLSSFARRSSKK